MIFKFQPFPEIITERLCLRQITMNDNQSLFNLRTDETVMKFIDKPRPKYIHETNEFIQKINLETGNNESINWGVSLKNNDTLIGTIGFWRIMKEHYRAEIGYMLHPSHHGKGLMTEGLKAVLGYGFDTMKLHSVEANVNPLNAASVALLKKLGFVQEGYFRENYFFNGIFLDSATYSLLNHAASK